MAARVHSVYNVLETIRVDIEDVCKAEGLSPDLLWLLIRQQADYELLLLAEKAK